MEQSKISYCEMEKYTLSYVKAFPSTNSDSTNTCLVKKANLLERMTDFQKMLEDDTLKREFNIIMLMFEELLRMSE